MASHVIKVAARHPVVVGGACFLGCLEPQSLYDSCLDVPAIQGMPVTRPLCGERSHPNNRIPTGDQRGFVADEPEGCRDCYGLIRSGRYGGGISGSRLP